MCRDNSFSLREFASDVAFRDCGSPAALDLEGRDQAFEDYDSVLVLDPGIIYGSF